MAERTAPPTSQNPVLKNQPPPFKDMNLFASDTVLREAVAREGGAVIDEIVIPGQAAERREGKGIRLPKVAS